GGRVNGAGVGRGEGEIVDRVRRELREALGITVDPTLSRVWRHPSSMPQYAVGHLTTVETIEQRVAAAPGLFLAGGGYRGVGIADCVRSAEAAADAASARR